MMVERSEVMYVIREVLNCKPGKVRQMVENVRGISTVLKVKIDDFLAMEQTLMANETLRKTMADYHDLVASGRREIYRNES